MKKIQQRFKKGVASFYIVAFSTLILVIIAASFATVILSEVTRTSNEDLSESAYDSALAGIEDAKLAFVKYRECEGSNTAECIKIREFMKNGGCDMVAQILGRQQDENGGVDVGTTTNDNIVTEQAYTCVIMRTELENYQGNLTASNQAKVIKPEFAKAGVTANNITSIRLSWYNNTSEQMRFTNFGQVGSDWRVTFSSLEGTASAAPPTIALQMVQTSDNFTMNDLWQESSGDRTDRATMYFVPTNDATQANANNGTKNTYTAIALNGTQNKLSAQQVLNTNNNSSKNLPFLTYCSNSATDEFACSVDIELPKPVGSGTRNNDTFMFVVALPYGQPDADYRLEFFCGEGVNCTTLEGSTTNQATLLGMQVLVDSTGRANDLYRRVEARLEPSGTSYPYPYYAIELFGGDGSHDALNKTLYVTN